MTKIERQIIALQMLGFKNRYIAQQVGLTSSQLKSAIGRIHEKPGITRQNELFGAWLDYQAKERAS